MVDKAVSFEFDSYRFDKDERKAYFTYTVHFSNKSPLQFTESIYFPLELPNTKVPSELIDACLYNLHLMFGVNYWKMYCPAEMKINTRPITKEQAVFWDTVYTKGFGEFFYTNNIDFRGLIRFPGRGVLQYVPTMIKSSNRYLVGIGGGKDSIVALEMLKNKKETLTGFIIETGKKFQIPKDVADAAEIKYIVIQRNLDKQLYELNQAGIVYNGHIPVSAVYAFVGLLTAVLYGYDAIVVANEKSANIGSVQYLGQDINHQWSKSSEFEQLFQQYIKKFITPSIQYISLLRSYSELEISEMFSRYKQYFPIFSSCNSAFKFTSSTDKRWCGACAKCAFVFVSLSAYVSRKELFEIFGKNLFADESLIPTYRQLLGLEGIKPFDCVGTPEEVRAAFTLASKRGEYAKDPVMGMFERSTINL